MNLRDLPPRLLERGFALPLHRYLQMEIAELGPPVRVSLRLCDEARTHAGALHGGATATLIDVASNLAASTSPKFNIRETSLVTVNMAIRYCNQPRGTVVEAEARMVFDGYQLFHVDTTVVDDVGVLVATGTTTCMLLRRRAQLESLDDKQVSALGTGDA